MLKAGQGLRLTAFLLILCAQEAGADLLFSNFDGDPSGALWTSGGDCSFASCFGIGDNFSANADWKVTDFIFYIASPLSAGSIGPGTRFAVFTAAGAQVVAPTSVTPTVTDTGLTGANNYPIYKFEISGLNIDLVPGQYQLRFTNTGQQSVFPGIGAASAQTIAPGLFQLTGSQSVESLLSTGVTQRTENWAFQVIGAIETTFENGFEPP